ncbi:TRAP transporter substrate-binding protein DctP [Mesorhizobium sp. LHD-90]|uniref:TRAP transporter substrate-binding protein n=1 Tax=Mesorhizobium sp. LHD-90 TaxID=3071414 RepID=UPI0027E0385E|nr:TRAP transporter substrate-binding protein DctP [Mesorhizobium sp. LHD-90]MDQ6436966.1 TRAP transporter substrate-binding protein DctP [Mesorhizobium sp. LHD-90]
MSAYAADFEWKMFTIYDVADKQTEWAKGFAAEVKEATGGRLNIRVFSGSELPYKGVDVYRAIAGRQIEIGHSPTGFIASDLPVVAAMSMPFVCTDMHKFFDGALPKVRPMMDQAISDKFKATPIMHWAMPGQQIWSVPEVKTIADLKGRKIRTWNREQVETLDKLGATSASITTAEVTQALQLGTVDGAITAAINANNWHWSQVLKNGYMFNITLSHEVISANNAALAELPEDVRKTFMEVAVRWEAKFREEVFRLDSAAREALVGQGMTLSEPNADDAKALREMTVEIGKNWAEANGEVAQEILTGIQEGCK